MACTGLITWPPIHTCKGSGLVFKASWPDSEISYCFRLHRVSSKFFFKFSSTEIHVSWLRVPLCSRWLYCSNRRILFWSIVQKMEFCLRDKMRELGLGRKLDQVYFAWINPLPLPFPSEEWMDYYQHQDFHSSNLLKLTTDSITADSTTADCFSSKNSVS